MQAVEGMATSGVVVATIIASMSLVAMPDLRIASSAALIGHVRRLFVRRPAQRRSRMPVTW